MDICGSLQLLNSSHVRERDKALLRAIMVGGVWNGFLLGHLRGQPVPCRFCGGPDHDGHLFWECTFPPLVEIRENPEFHDLMRMDKAHWPRCLLWHGWLPMLSGVNGASPWAVDASESAAYLVEVALGRYSSGLITEWVLLMILIMMMLLLLCRIILMSGLMAVWFLIDLLVFLLLAPVSLLIRLNVSGGVVGGVMLMVFTLVLIGRIVEVSLQFLVLCSLFKELKCGVLF